MTSTPGTRQGSLILAAVLGGIVGAAFMALVQSATEERSGGHGTDRELALLAERIGRAVERGLSQRETPPPGPPRESPEPGFLPPEPTKTGEDVGTEPGPAGAAVPYLPPEIDALRTQPARRELIEALRPTQAKRDALTRRYLLRTYREIIEQFGFPDQSSVASDSVWFRYRYKNIHGGEGLFTIKFVGGLALEVWP